MRHFTTDTYALTRDILNFSNKLFRCLSKSDRKFNADMLYGMLASSSCLLTDIADQLHENTKKINTVDRLSKHLAKGISRDILKAYLLLIRKWSPAHPVIHINDSDIVKPDGLKFESLGMVRDGSESTRRKNVYQKGYHVTEATVLTSDNHPVSIFSRIHSSKEKNFTSINEEYFRCKKQVFQFENFRVRKLKAINALNFYITVCMAFLAHISMKSNTNTLKTAIIQKANPIREKVSFCYYRLAKGISGILSYAKEGIRLWFKTTRPVYRQLCFKMVT